MKKAFNFRSAIVCVLVLIMCLTAFVACNDKKDGQDDLSGLAKAKDYVKQLYINNNEETAADYTVVSKVNIAGTIYNVSWTVAITTEGADAGSVKVVAGESNVTIDVIDMAESEIKYVLTATITDAKGNTETVSFNRKVPKFHVSTWAEYAAAEDGKLLVVDGIVTMFNSKGNGDKYNSMYIQDADGAYYAYSMDEDPKDKNIAVGMKVRLTGTKKTYNGTYELEKVLIKEVLDTNVQVVAPINIDELLANVTSAKDKNLTNLQGSIVTLSGAILVEVDDSQKYCYFTVGGIKTYIRPSKSAGFLSDEEITAFMKAFKENKAHTATITGQALVYNNAFYMQPISKDAVEYGAVADLTPAEQVKFVKDNANALSNVTYSGYSVTLPGASDVFTDVKIAWTADNTEICKIVDGKATFTYDYATEGRKVKLTATYTHATDTTVAPLTNEYELELLIPQDATVEEFLTKDVDNSVYKITGTIVAKQTDGTKDGAFVLADKTGAVFSYVKTSAELGSVVTVFATRTSNGSGNYVIPQLGTKAVIAATDVEAVTPQVEETIDMANFDLATAKAENYVGKYLKITGISVKANEGRTDRIYLTVDGKNAVVHGFTEKEAFYGAYNERVGTGLIVYGYCRGLSSSYLSIQVANLEEKPLNDTEKVASAKAGLSDLTTNKDFDLPTSKIATITWALTSGTGATLEGNHVTITQTDADQNVVFTATIVSGEASDTKDITVTIKAKDNRVAGVKGVVGTAYKIVMNQTTLNKTLYLNGKMAATYYFGTTENVDEAVDVYLEVVSEEDGTFRLYTMIDNAKKYIEIVPSGSHINVKFNDTVAGNPWTWNDTLKMYQTAVSGAEGKENGNYTLGTYGDKNTFSAQIVTSTSSFFAQLYGTPDPAPVKTNQELVDEAAEALRKDFTITAKSSGATIDLAATGINNATIVWTSSDNAVIAIGALTDGKYVATVNNPTTDGMTVTLTAVLTVGEGDEAKTANCTFPITVTRTLANVEVSLGEITGGTVDVFVGENKQTLPVTLKQEQVITLTPVATDGYELVKVFVNGTELAKGTDGASYTYTLGTTNVQITATFRMITFVTVSVEETIANGSVTVNVGKDALDTSKQYRDGTVLTITATANAGYKLVAVKVNGEKLTGNTYTIKETDTTVAITVEINEIQAMTIAEFKASVDNTEAKVTGIVTNIDSKATWIQDTEGNALYVYATKLAGVEVGKKVTLTGIKGVFNGLLQLKTPVVVKVEDTTDTIAPVVLDEAAYKALTANDAAKLVNVNGLVYVSGTANTDKGGTLSFKLGETIVSVRVEKGDAAALNSAVLSKLKSGDKVNLTNVNIGWFNSAQIALSAETQVEVVWDLEAVSDKTELVVNGTATITATITPAYMAEKVGAITFSTSDDKVLTVDNTNGTVTAVGVGEDAYIIVSAGGKTVNVPIKVVAAASAYTVTYSVDGGNGSIASVMDGENPITSGVTTVGADTVITVTVAPAEGYRLASYTLNGGDAVAANGETSFDVTVTDNVTIVVTFELIPTGPETLTSANFAGKAKDEFVSVDGWTLNVAKGCYSAVGGVFHSSFRKDKESVTSNTFKAQNSVDVTFHWYLNNKSTSGSMSSKLKFEGLDASGKVVATYTSEELNGTTVQKPADMKVTLTGEGIVQVKITFVKNGGGNIGFSTITIATTVA